MKILRTAAHRLWHSDLLVSWGAMAVRLFSMGLVLPAILLLFPAAEAALWFLALLIIGLTVVASFGLEGTYARVLAYAMAGGEIDDIPHGANAHSKETEIAADGSPNPRALGKLVSTMAATSLVLTGLSLILGTGAYLFSTRQIISQLDDPSSGAAVLMLAVLTFAASVWGQQHVAWLVGTGRILILKRLELLTGFGHMGSLLAVMLLDGGLVVLIIVHCSWLWVVILRNAWLSRRFDIEGAFAKAPLRFERDAFERIWPAQWRLGVATLSSFGVLQLSGLIVAGVATPASSAIYLFSLRLATTVSSISQPAFYNRIPAFAALWAQGDLSGLVKTTRWRLQLSYWSFSIAHVGIGVFVTGLLMIFPNTGYTFDIALWTCFGIAFFAERMAGMHAQLVMLTNFVPYKLSIYAGILAILTGGPLTYAFGEIGMPIGYALGMIIGFLPHVMRLSYAALPLGWPDYEKRTSLYPFLLILAYSVVVGLL